MKKSEEQYQALDSYLEEARAGAPDDWLAKRTGLSIKLVKRWKVSRGITLPAGGAEQLAAIQGLAQSYNARLHIVGSDLQGQSRPPEYMIREPLDYSLLCRAVYTLAQYLGMEDSDLAVAFGLRTSDIITARLAYESHLRRKGKKCSCCDTVIDPKFGPYCSARCRDADTV